MDIENIGEETPSLKEAYSSSYGGSHGKLHPDIKLSKDFKSVEEDCSGKQQASHSSYNIETQKTLFQRNLDAVNQPQRNIQDFSVYSLKKEEKEKPVTDGSTEWSSQTLPNLDENQKPRCDASIDQQAAPLQPAPPSPATADQQQPASRTASPPPQPPSDADSLLDGCSISSPHSPADPQSPADPPALDPRSPKTQSPSRLPTLQAANLDRQPPAINADLQADAGLSEPLAEQGRADVAMLAAEPVIAYLIDGDDKENVSPLVLDDLTDKPALVDGAAGSCDDPGRGPENTLMDQDKEPVFADENLQPGSDFIVDEESLSRKNRSLNEECIYEVEKMVLEDHNGAIVESETKEEDKPTEISHIKSENQVNLLELIISQANQLESENQKDIHLQNNLGKTLPAIKIVQSKGIRQQLNSSQKSLTQKSNLSNQKPSINLTKRPPLAASASAYKPKTPCQAMRQQGMSKLKMLSAIKEQLSPLVIKGEQRSHFKDREVSSPFLLKSSEKASRKPSVPKIFTLTPNKGSSLRKDVKICPEIAARIAEAERILQLKKPPVPKFTAQGKVSVKKVHDSSQADLRRKPPVPKFSDLFKKK
jgi:hypothetical protein